MCSTIPRHVILLNFHPLEVVSRYATHNFKWVKITYICLIWVRPFAIFDVYTLISFVITVIFSALKSIMVDYSLKSWHNATYIIDKLPH